MTDRPRFLRPFWSRREPSTPWLSPEDTYGSAGRDVAEVTGRPRRLRSRSLATPTGRIADEAIAGWGRVLELGEQAAADLAAVRGQRDVAADALYDMTEGMRAALLSAGYFHPSDDLVADVRHMASEYVRSVAELRSATREKDDLERRVFELEGRAAKPNVIEGGRLP